MAGSSPAVLIELASQVVDRLPPGRVRDGIQNARDNTQMLIGGAIMADSVLKARRGDPRAIPEGALGYQYAKRSWDRMQARRSKGSSVTPPPDNANQVPASRPQQQTSSRGNMPRKTKRTSQAIVPYRAPKLKQLTMSPPTMVGTITQKRRPTYRSIPNGIVVGHTEFVCDVVTPSSGGQVSTYQLSPANPLTFPWLSRIASSFSSYKMRSLRLEYRTEAATTGTGVVVLAYDKDPNMAWRASKQLMLESQDSISGPPWTRFGLNCDVSKNNNMVVYGQNLPTGATAIQYSFGSVAVACFNVTPVSSTVGEVWMSYDIELTDPIVENVPQWNLKASFSSYSTSTLFPALTSITQSGNFNLSAPSGNTITVSGGAGGYLLVFMIQSTASVSTFTLASVSGGTVTNQSWTNGTSNSMLYASYVVSAGVTSHVLTFTIAANNLNTAVGNTLYIAGFDSQVYG